MTPEENRSLSVDRLVEKGLDPQRKRRVPVPIRLVAALAALIGLGTMALLLPGMTTRPITFMDALFTATSAAAVTGLAVLSTSTDFTRLGQWVILLLMQVGGLGFLVTLVLTVRLLWVAGSPSWIGWPSARRSAWPAPRPSCRSCRAR